MCPSLEIANLLIKCCESYLRANFNVDIIVANAEFNGNGRIGVLSKGFEHAPFILEGYNPQYYNSFFTQAGYCVKDFGDNAFKNLEDCVETNENSMAKCKSVEDKWYSFIVSKKSDSLVETLERYKKRFNNSDRNKEQLLRKVNFESIDSDVEKLIDFYNGVWSTGKHPDFRKMTPKEMNTLKDDLLLVCSQDLTVMLENNANPKEPNLIGALIGVYDINETIREIDEPFMSKVRDLFYEDNAPKATELINAYTSKMNLFFRDLQIIRRHFDKLRNNKLNCEEEKKRRKLLPLSIRIADSIFPTFVHFYDFFGYKNKPMSLKFQGTDEMYKQARILIMGVDEGFRRRGYDVRLMVELFKNISERLPSIQNVSGSLVAEVNLDMAGPLGKLGEKALEYSVYTKEF